MSRALPFLLQVVLIVHTLNNNQQIAINPRAITTIGAPGIGLTEEANCLITLVCDKFVTTKESCREVLELIAKMPTGGWLDSQ